MEDYSKLGLTLILDFITEEEETTLLSFVSRGQKKKTKDRNSIKRFGSRVPYNGNVVSESVPAHYDVFCDKLIQQNLLTIKPDSVTLNEYLAGQGISPHIDSKGSGEVITVMSLLSDARMKFERNGNSFYVDLPRRSLVQMRDEIRHHWRHSVDPVQADRYSLVFRCSDTTPKPQPPKAARRYNPPRRLPRKR